MSKSIATFVLVLALGLAPLAAQPAFEVADLGHRVTDNLLLFGYAVRNGVTYFDFNDGIHGYELWRSDGTALGTRLVKDLCPGSCPGALDDPTVLGSLLYFQGSDGGNLTLFQTDGTAAGTLPVFPKASALDQKGFRTFGTTGGKLLLLSQNTALGQYELWATDGTVAGTALLKRLGPIPNPSFLPGPVRLGRVGATLFFSVDDGVHGREPWKTDGTSAGTALVKDIFPGSPSSILFDPSGEPQDLPSIGGALLFSACDDTQSCQLWKSDGTEAGTALVHILRTGGSFVRALTGWNGEVVFFASQDSGWSLFKSDGTDAGTVPVGPPLTLGGEIAEAGSRIFFTACDGTNGCRLWKSDGTDASTTTVGSVIPTNVNSTLQSSLTAVGGRAFLFSADSTNTVGDEPWGSDGTDAGTVLLADIAPGMEGSDGDLHSGGTRIFANAANPGQVFLTVKAADGWELWGSDGTPAGTASLAPINIQTPSLPEFFSSTDAFADVSGKALFFTKNPAVLLDTLYASDGSAPGTTALLVLPQAPLRSEVLLGGQLYFDNYDLNKLWRSDGTVGGTAVFWDGGGNRRIGGLALAGTELFFSSWDSGDLQLWKSDGTPGGTSLVQDIPTPGGLGFPTPLYALGNRVFFRVDSPAGDLWESDGTNAGTGPIILPGQTASLFAPTQLVPAGQRLFFNANGTELWVTDGTGAGTTKLGQFSSFAGTAVAASGRLFFLADDGIHGSELWTSDGTATGTHLVADIFPGASGAFPASVGFFPYPMTALFGRLYFPVDDGVHGKELWVSDGSAAGTHLVKDLLPGAGSSFPANLATIGHLIFFAATDGVHDVEIWQSDGTAAGTKMVQDIAPGDLPSNPDGFAAVGPYIYFAANDGTHGSEPWALPRANLGGFLTATMTASDRTEEAGMMTYTLTVTNVGAGPQGDNPGAEVTDTLPIGVAVLGAMAGSGTVTVNAGQNRIDWNGSLAPGASVTILIQGRVDALLGSVESNQATLAFDADGDGTNESSGVSDDPTRPGTSDPTTFSVATGPLGFYRVPLCRAVDTRGINPLVSGTPQTFTIGGTCNVPQTARAIAVNLTVVVPSTAGFLTIYPSNTPVPFASGLNFSRAQTRSNNTILPLASFGRFDAKAGLPGGGQLDLVVDVVGYFQ